MISSEEGLSILKKWKRAKTRLVFGWGETRDSLTSFDAIVKSVSDREVFVEMLDVPEEVRRLDIHRARFAMVYGDETVEDFPMPENEMRKYSVFLFILPADQSAYPMFLAAPVPIN